MLVQESWVEVQNAHSDNEKRFRCGDSGLYEPYTEDIKRLFRSYMHEYGRCVSKVYIDTSEGVKAIGWVFEKRMKYTDCNDTYLQETWVTLHEDEPTIIQTDHYHFLQ